RPVVRRAGRGPPRARAGAAAPRRAAPRARRGAWRADRRPRPPPAGSVAADRPGRARAPPPGRRASPPPSPARPSTPRAPPLASLEAVRRVGRGVRPEQRLEPLGRGREPPPRDRLRLRLPLGDPPRVRELALEPAERVLGRAERLNSVLHLAGRRRLAPQSHEHCLLARDLAPSRHELRPFDSERRRLGDEPLEHRLRARELALPL